MHKETYPSLYKKFPLDNFDTIITVLQRDYADLYPLDIMEQYYKESQEETLYSKFFNDTFRAFAGKYTELEIQKAVLDVLDSHKNTMLNNPFFFPAIRSGVPKPLGFMEKMATGDLTSAEPLTYVDMLRAGIWFTSNSKSFSGERPNYRVIPLANLSAQTCIENVSFINLQNDPKKTPKWIVLDYRNSKHPRVFCEAPLLESEKVFLEEQIGNTIAAENYEGGKAALSISTGYTALAWCMENVERVCALTLESDFLALVEEFTFIQPNVCSENSAHNSYYSEEFSKFCGKGLYFLSGNSVYSFARAAILGRIGAEHYKPNDFCAALKPYNEASYEDKKRQTDLNARTYILGFDAALKDVKYLEENVEEQRIRLTVPETVSRVEIEKIFRSYSKFSSKYKVDSYWLANHVMRPENSIDSGEGISYATAMVLAVFRSRAKMANLEITLPEKYQLDAIETDFIEQFMQNNAYVCQLELGKGNNNRSMLHLKNKLLPVFARNRWLANNGYKPPMFDDFWKKAAYYWLLHLQQTPDVLLETHENEFFKDCVTEMGIEGLQSVLSMLNNEVERAAIEKIYGSTRPPFYLNCRPEEMAAYLDLLLTHLKYHAYFPFSELGITFSVTNSLQIERLIVALNELDRFEQVTLTDCLKNCEVATEFLRSLAAKAQEQKWTTLLVIPELHDKENVSEKLIEIRSVYAHLNNIILHNLREKKAEGELHQIEEISNFAVLDAVPELDNKPNEKAESSIDFEAHIQQLQHQCGRREWPIQRGGETQLQLQQQQEIQQARQLQQAHQRMNVHQVEEAFFEGLISYDNIDDRLGRFFENYLKEHKVDPKYALLKTPSESLLQGFFHTWINANPAVQAEHVIRFMTKDAFVQLLKQHNLMISGLKLDNLSKGFFLQRTKDGDYILSYKADMDYVNPPNARTLRTDVRTPELEAWEGDFRQFDVEQYIEKKESIEKQDWLYMAIFASLQPPRDYTEDYHEFCRRNPKLASKLGQKNSSFLSSLINAEDHSAIRENVIKNWPIVIQAWQYAGEKGIDQYLEQDPDDFKLRPEEVKIFLTRHLSTELREFINRYPMEEKILLALGQVYYRFGNKGLTLLFSKLLQIEHQFGREFYETFYEEILCRCDNYNVFIKESFFTAMDSMMQQLQGYKNAGVRNIWKNIICIHYQSTDWDDIVHLWKAFSSFHQELARAGLELEGDEFDGIGPDNMILYMDRVLDCIAHIPNHDKQKAFLRNLQKWDMSHGGLPYAIVHEHFRNFDQSLLLYNFTEGTPTYAPDLVSIYVWTSKEAPLKIQRSLASLAQINQENFQWLQQKFESSDRITRDLLVMLVNTRFNTNRVRELVEDFSAMTPAFSQTIASRIHQAIHKNGHRQLVLDWSALNLTGGLNYAALLQELKYDSNLLLLETLSILYQQKQLTQENLDALCRMHHDRRLDGADFTQYHDLIGFKLAAVYGIQSTSRLQELTRLLNGSRPIVQQEVRLLFRHLLGVEYSQTDIAVLQDAENWKAILQCIRQMETDPANTAEHRLALIEAFSDKGIQFKFSKGGNYRALGDKADEGPDSLRFFPEHEERVWKFLQQHIAVNIEEDVQEQIAPIINFLKQLQLNVTYLNEIEPLLSVLEKTPKGHYWSAQYFMQMLNALLPEDEKSAFPISLMKILVEEHALKARKMDEINEDFPQKVADILRLIRGNTIFLRDEQAMLAQIALREYHWADSTSLVANIIGTLTGEAFANSRTVALEILTQCENKAELEQRYNYCKELIELPVTEIPQVNALWSQTLSLWLGNMRGNHHIEELFERVKAKYGRDPEKRILVLHIMAWSSLHEGLKNSRAHKHQLLRKAPKLIEALATLEDEALIRLVDCYPHQPCPTAADILSLLKESQQTGQSFETLLTRFEMHPYAEPRADYHHQTISRNADLERMLKEVHVSYGEHKRPLDLEESARVLLFFTYLKELESGKEKIVGCDKAISDMTQLEIAGHFKVLSLKLLADPNDDRVKGQVFALMFEAMGRSTRKYPHLAQQFALITNDLFINADSRVLQLSVGEGKSHYVAMRAAQHAAQGKCVDVCTAKRSLAVRDLDDDYKDFFHYLGLTATTIHPKSTHENYLSHQIHYTTLGDLSLFLDEQNYNGTPIEIPKEERVGLFDEFDFIRFEEGRKTEYNFAKPTGYTPKQLIWFYQAVNRFYDEHQVEILEDNEGNINLKILVDFAHALVKEAAEMENRQSFVARFISDPLRMVQYLQSAHEAANLQRGVNFTVHDKIITVGDEHYPMREVIPLSSDNQRMSGSTFSAGVHQLLAVRLNTQAQYKDEPQNFHVHPESHILSSQVAAFHMQNLWQHREGFTGTISEVQRQRLYHDEKTVVLHAPTNRAVQRKLHSATFYKNADERTDALIEQLIHCFENKQSILVCCKNDKQVEFLQQQLSEKFGPEYMEQLLFYTNEDPRSAKDVLNDKTHMEDWHDDIKTRGIGLIASGFGRGDNTNTEAVFILGARDFNDLTQKGGRTARNGEEGEVYQFYLTDELLHEERLYKERLERGTGEMRESLTILCEAYPGEDEESLLQRVLVLREYCFELDNIVNESYHHIMAQYSGWGMRLLAKVDDPVLRQDLTSIFSNGLRRLEKIWIEVEADGDISIEQKQEALQEQFTLLAEEFTAEYSVKLETEAAGFVMGPLPTAMLKLSIPENQTAREPSAEISQIYLALNNLSDIDWEDKRIQELPEKLNTLQEDRSLLRFMGDKMRYAKSAKEFLDSFERMYAAFHNPSDLWAQEIEGMLEPTPAEHVMIQIFDEVRSDFLRLMVEMNKSVRDKVGSYLQEGHTASINERAKRLLPVLRYLAKFNPGEQEQLGADYINNIDIISEHYSDIMKLGADLPVMPCKRLIMFSDLLRRFPDPFTVGNVTLIRRFYQMTSQHPEMQIRILTRCETLAGAMPASEANRAFHNFIQVINKGIEAGHWNIMNRLLSNTEEWWGKRGHRSEILELWRVLTAHSEHLGELNSLLNGILKRPNKAWYSVLLICLNTISLEKNKAFQEQWLQIWDKIDSLPSASLHKREYFRMYIEHLSQYELDEVISNDYLTMLLDCYQQIIERNLEPAQTQQALKTMIELCNQYPINELMAFVRAMDEAGKHENSTALSRLNIIKLYHLCREHGIQQKELCSENLIRVLYLMMENMENASLEFNEHDMAYLQVGLNIMDSIEPHLLLEFVRIYRSSPLNREGSPLANAELITVYKLCREVGIEHAQICNKDFIDILNLMTESSEFVTSEFSVKNVNTFKNELKVIASIEPGLCKQLIDGLQQHSSTLRKKGIAETIGLLGLCQHEGMNQAMLYRYRDILLQTWERLLTTEEYTKSKALFIEYAHNLAKFDREKLDGFIREGSLSNSTYSWQFINKLLADVLDFNIPEKQSTRIWRMRFLQDGVLMQLRLQPQEMGTCVGEFLNNQVLKRAFAYFAEEMQSVFAFASPERKATPEERVKAHTKALGLAEEIRLIGTLTPIKKVPSFEDDWIRQRNAQLGDGLHAAVRQYQSHWFLASSRRRQSKELLEELQYQNMRESDSLKHILVTLKSAKLEAMHSDRRLNETRWFKINRSGRSRYYEVLNQMQDIVMQHWASEQFRVGVYSSPLEKQNLFQMMPEYREFILDDFHAHLKFFAESVRLHVDKEKSTKRLFFRSYHSNNNQELEYLSQKLESLAGKELSRISSDDMGSLQLNLTFHEEYLPGELRALQKELLQRTQVVQELFKSENSNTALAR